MSSLIFSKKFYLSVFFFPSRFRSQYFAPTYFETQCCKRCLKNAQHSKRCRLNLQIFVVLWLCLWLISFPRVSRVSEFQLSYWRCAHLLFRIISRHIETSSWLFCFCISMRGILYWIGKRKFGLLYKVDICVRANL